MRRFLLPAVAAACLAGLTLACFSRVLLRGEQFGYRDAAHFYYPLYQRVEAEWRAGRWPLWEPEENGGMPLLGNPTAAVLYPGKLIFTVTPYPWGMRLYVVGHTLLAFAAMVVLLRGWHASGTASVLAGLGYAFSGPVLFQYCNVIYLVGAAWAPLGLHAVDVWLRRGRRIGIVELALVLAMETLGGDPEVAYLTGVAAAGYAWALARARQRGEVADSRVDGPMRRWLWRILGVALFVAWFAGVLGMERVAMAVRTHSVPPSPLPWMGRVPRVILGVWVLVALRVGWLWVRRRPGVNRWLVPMMGGLILAAALAALVSAAQLLPVLEFANLSARAAGEGPHDIFPFSLSPWRVAEFLWPNVFGTPFQGNRSWTASLPPATKTIKTWVPTLYAGSLTVVLGLAASRLGRHAQPWRVWLTAIGWLSLLAAFGECTGPLFWARFHPDLVSLLGPHDPNDSLPIRLDDHLRDGDGGLYWAMATFLPGFRQFRFPSKLLTFTVAALSALAGLGWDDLTRHDPSARRRVVGWSILVLLVTLAAGLAAALYRHEFSGWLERSDNVSPFGPFDVPGAYREMVQGIGQGGVVVLIGLALLARRRHRPQAAAAAVLVLVTVDLALANAAIVLSVDQRLLDAPPEVLQAIQREEAKDPSPGPYRIHRVPIWNPPHWSDSRSSNRVADFVEWERATLQPKYGINEGVSFALTFGVAELYDYEFFFAGFPRRANAEMQAALGVPAESSVIYFPRRSYDMWTARYFVVPYVPRWDDEHRGIASFLDQSRRVYPGSDAFRGDKDRSAEKTWARTRDVQVLRNHAVFPRAWVVHQARTLPPLEGAGRAERARPMEEMLFANDPVWRDPTRTAYDPRSVVWVEQHDRAGLAPFLPGTPRGAEEEIKVVRYESDRVELEANLRTPGVVILADVYYPGWELTIDDRPAPLYRANRMMRGAGVPSGRHTLVYTYRPSSFRFGKLGSIAGLLTLLLFAGFTCIRPVSKVLAPAPDAGAEAMDQAAMPGPEEP